MFFLLVNFILLFSIFFLFIVLSMIWPPDSPWAPWWRTNKKIANAACKLAGISAKDTVYELGSGDGTFLISAAKDYGAKAVGIEIDPLRYFFSKVRIFFIQSPGAIIIQRENFFNIDISYATVVFVYLVPKALERLLPKFKKELKKGTKIISYKYKANLNLIKEDKENKLYLYKIV